MLDPGMGGVEDRLVDLPATPDLAPPPFAGVDPTAFVEVLRPDLAGEGSDARGLVVCGVVFPEPDMGVEVLRELRLQGQRSALRVHRDGSAPGRIDPESDHLRRIEAGSGRTCLFQCSADDRDHPVEIVLRVLPCHIRVRRVGEDAHFARRIRIHDGSQFLPGIQIHKKGTAGIRPVVQTNSVSTHSQGYRGRRRAFQLPIPPAVGIFSVRE